MKTFVTDDYQVTLRDNGGVEVLFEGVYTDIRILYDPDSKSNWLEQMTGHGLRESNSITGLGLSTRILKKLCEALEVVGKQDLFDKEIVFVNKEDKQLYEENKENALIKYKQKTTN